MRRGLPSALRVDLGLAVVLKFSGFGFRVSGSGFKKCSSWDERSLLFRLWSLFEVFGRTDSSVNRRGGRGEGARIQLFDPALTMVKGRGRTYVIHT